ncbi:hypothetical protein AB6A40_007264 [Gnathostoma spinigerum]|uniref:Fibronectin type-III domain-containing protein n=1 Tax=Gnathostoma spinigerum TaxID=75299 RepID=A0ABD6EKQ0_9BILA
MEPIPEEDHETTSGVFQRTIEQKSRLKEVFTSEQVDTLVSALPESSISDSLKLLDIGKSGPSTCVTDMLTESPAARSSNYSYTYESHYDELPSTSPQPMYDSVPSADGEIERRSTQCQKITRVTKVTTTQCVKQVPIVGKEMFFDAEGSPLTLGDSSPLQTQTPYSESELLELGIGFGPDDKSLSDHFIETRDAPPPAPNSHSTAVNYPSFADFPSAPGAPQVTGVDSSKVSIAWLRPESDGRAGAIIGYRVEVRKVGTTEWRRTNDYLLQNTQCTVGNLDSLGEYQFRVLAANPLGFGAASEPSSVVVLRPHFNNNGTLKERINPPGRPFARSLSANKVLLEWSSNISPHGTSLPVGYYVEFREYGDTEWTRVNKEPIVSCQYEVRNLSDTKTYQFRIVSVDYSGFGVASKASGAIRTSCGYSSADALTSCPGRPYVCSTSDDKITLEWLPVYPDSSSCPFIGYNVEYFMRDASDWVKCNDELITFEHYEVCTKDFDDTKDYMFRVIAVNSAGFGTASQPTSYMCIRPHVDSSEQKCIAPGKPSVRPSGSGSLFVEWTPAGSESGPSTDLHYRIEYRVVTQRSNQAGAEDVSSWQLATVERVSGCCYEGICNRFIWSITSFYAYCGTY